MHLGISSYTYGWAVGANALAALDLIDRAAELNVRILQICDNLPAHTYEDDSVQAIAAHARRRGIQIELGTRGIAADHLKQFAAVARRLNSPILRVVIDSADDHPTADEVVRRLDKVMPVFADARVILSIENHDRFPVASLVEIITKLNTPYVGICLDTANSFGALEGPEVVVNTLGPYVANLHLKDFAVQRFAHLQGFTVEGRPAGHGMLNIPWLLDRLRTFGRDPNAIIELWTPPEPAMEQTIRKEAEWATLSVQTARRWVKE